MTPTDFQGSNVTLHPPEGMANCDRIRAHIQENPGGGYIYITMWQPTPEELARLNEGMPVQLCMLANQFPPVALGVAQPA